MRIGDRERDEVTRLLHDAFAQGRITREELDERLEATLSARTAEDLRRVTADLPGAWPGDARAGDAWTGGAHDGPSGPPRGPWHPGYPRPYGGPWAGAAAWGRHPGALWARGHRHPHGWGPHPGHLAVQGGLPLIAIAGVVLTTVALVSGVAWPLFVILRLLFVAWLISAVVGMIRHRHHGRRYGAWHR
ncbi:MAG: DUF1707 domain-containing protein [Microbispora sp.]|nr:DUF1707 domain-containing protein [Microbispora sp.]